MEALERLTNADIWHTGIIEEDIDYMVSKFGEIERFAGKRVVMTGGGGFIGFYMSHFFAKLGLYGAPVKQLLVLDRFPDGVPGWLSCLEKEGLPVLAKTFDVRSDSFRSAVADADFVLHLASIASPAVYRQFPLETLEANVFGLRNLLEACLGQKLEGILFFSSSEVYGNPAPDAIPTPETYNGDVATIGPRACYDESKRFGETLCSLYEQVHGLPLRIVRPFNNYGPGLLPQDGRILADFARAALEGGDLVIHSDGTPTRTYCYIADAIIGYLKVLTYDRLDVFNIGADEPEMTVSELAEVFARVAGELLRRDIAIRYQQSADRDYLKDNPQRRCPDLRKARTLLGYHPEISLKEGIHRYLRALHGGSL